MDNGITVKEVIENVIKELNEIRIPMNLVKDIGFPIGRSIENLQACINAWETADQNKSESTGDEV